MNISEKINNRYKKYLKTYVDIIYDYSDELSQLIKSKKSGEIKIGKRKHTYFSSHNSVTVINRKNDLEISFYLHTHGEKIYFSKDKFHNYIESDLNAQGLGKDFPSNKVIREEKLELCFSNLLIHNIIYISGEGYIIDYNQL